MPFEWQDYYDIAQRLAAIEMEATWRSAISRAYYAVFHLAEKKYAEFNASPMIFEGGYSHHKVWEWFARQHNRIYKRIGNAGFSLKEDRVTADYSDEFPGLSAQVVYSLARAKQILDDLARIA